jgi:hypothetical protein
MGFFGECKEHPSVCGFGVMLGVVIALIIMFVYTYAVTEGFQDPNSMDPITQSLLQQKYKSDPIVTRIPMGNREYLSNQSEHPGLIAQLWK